MKHTFIIKVIFNTRIRCNIICFRLFEQRCIRIMDGMYKEDTMHAAKAMKDEAMIWGVKTSPLAIAYENFMYEIVAHTCSRKHLNIKWYNELPPDLFSFYQVNMVNVIESQCMSMLKNIQKLSYNNI